MKVAKHSPAFTLTELLMVITVICILIGLLLPVFKSAMDKARTAKCATNLSSIYKAYQMRTADESQNYKWVPLRSAGWAGILLSYVDGKEKLFKCPEDRTGHWGGIDAMVTLGRINVNPLAGAGSNPFYTTTPLESGRNYSNASGPYHSTRDPWGSWNGVEVDVPGLPDNYVSIGWYRGAGPSRNGSWTICLSGGQAAQYRWNPMVPGNEGLVFTVFADRKKLRCDQDLIGVWLQDGRGVLNRKAAPNCLSRLVGQLLDVGMVTHCSYGMNDYDIEGGVWSSGQDWMLETYSYFWPKVPANKVLIMDYTNAQVAAHTMASNSVSWGTSVSRLRRHSAKTRSNVLFGDGTVQLLDPATIDPGVEPNYDKYWQPENP